MKENKWWGLSIFSSNPPKKFSPQNREKFGIIFGRKCLCTVANGLCPHYSSSHTFFSPPRCCLFFFFFFFFSFDLLGRLCPVLIFFFFLLCFFFFVFVLFFCSDVIFFWTWFLFFNKFRWLIFFLGCLSLFWF